MNRLDISNDFEKKVISGCIQNQDYYFLCKSNGVTDDFFQKPSYRELFQIMDKVALTDGISPLILVDHIKNQTEDSRKLNLAGLEKLKENTVSEVDMNFAIRKIKEFSSIRALNVLAQNIIASTNSNKDTTEILDNAMAELFNINTDNDNIVEYGSSDAVQAVGKEIKQRLDGEITDGVPSGIATLDREIKCFYYSLYSIIIGRPGHGKTTMMINCFLNNILAGYKPVFISMEMPAVHLIIKMLGILTEIPVNKIMMPRKLTNEELDKIKNALRELQKHEFYIVDAVSLNVIEFGMLLQKYVRKNCEIAYVDYIQLLKLPNNKIPNDAGEFRDVSKTSREIIKRVNRNGKMALVFGAQAGRSVEQRPIEDRIPQMKDLEWSSSFEQDAAVVLGIMNREKYEGEECEYKNQLFVGFPKHRYNTAIKTNLVFLPDIQFITDLARPERVEHQIERWNREIEKDKEKKQLLNVNIEEENKEIDKKLDIDFPTIDTTVEELASQLDDSILVGNEDMEQEQLMMDFQ